MPAFFKARRYCTKCEKVYHCNLDQHPFNEICKISRIPSCKKEGFFKCDWCKLVKITTAFQSTKLSFAQKKKKALILVVSIKIIIYVMAGIVKIVKLLLMLLKGSKGYL